MKNTWSVAAVGIAMIAMLAACSGKASSIPDASSKGSVQQPGNSFSPSSGSVPRSPQALSTSPPFTFNTYAIPCSNCWLHGIAVGPDRVYYTAWNGAFIGSISYSGVVGPQVSTLPNPNGLAEGINGGMYVSNYTGHGLGELAEDSFGGNIFGYWNDFGVTSMGTDDVASDPNGVLWYTESNNNSVIRMTTYGSLLSRTQLMTGATPSHIAVGADQNSMYVTEYGSNKIAKLDLNGNLLSETAIPQGHNPTFIAAGPDGNMYFTEYFGDSCGTTGYLGKVSSAMVITMYPTADCGDLGVASGSDGNVWFLESQKGYITQFNVSTLTQTTHALPSSINHAYGLASGADGQLWFTAENSSYIGSFQP